MKKTLYKRDASGSVREWSIEIDYEQESLLIEYGVLGGEMQSYSEDIWEGKASRDIDEQLELRFNSRVRNKMDAGYSEDINDAKKKPVNQLGLIRPMLAKNFKDGKSMIDWGNAFVQRKYNGHRCLVTNQGGEIIAYSRKGRVISSIDHIISGLEIEEGATLDGELYVHGMSLQRIGSLIKRKQPESELLTYMIYDMVSDKPFVARYNAFSKANPGKGAQIVPTTRVFNAEEAMRLFRQFRNEGYEGAMLRHGMSPYQDSIRSSSLLKVKEFQDSEFRVIDIKSSRDGWAILICEVNEDGLTFDVSAPGTLEDKYHVMENRVDFIGRFVTVEYSEFTDAGKPFQPVATSWREDV